MAKKSTWEKRANKARKEEHLVLGGSTRGKKSGFKKPTSKTSDRPRRDDKPRDYDKPRDNSKPRYTITREDGSSERPERRERTERPARSERTTRSDRPAPKRGERPTAKSGSRFERPERGGFKPKEKPFAKFRKEDERESAFKDKGHTRNKFRSGDNKKSHTKFLNDQHFDGLSQRGKQAGDLIRLNKYLSMAGICSRREADEFIVNGLVSVNGQTVTELGFKVKPTDEVKYAGERVKTELLRYILLNKPKDCITTVSDEKGRNTVMGLVKNACRERVFPVGRLDRNTTGLLLLTNDGDMAKKLTHPSHEVRKVYHVITDKNVSIADLKKLESGVELEDGIAKADAALFAGDGSVRNEIGLEIHSGKNRVVRRMFAALGYEVTRLDRAAFAGLSKKGLPRGRWRFLTEKEIAYLKML